MMTQAESEGGEEREGGGGGIGEEGGAAGRSVKEQLEAMNYTELSDIV